MSQPDLVHIKLSQLGISKLNMRRRSGRKGFRKPLLVRREGV